MIKPRKRLLDTAAIAQHYGVKVGTVRSWASRYGWTPYGGRRDRLWDLNEIQAKFDELETKRTMTTTFEHELAAAAKRRGLGPDLPDAELRAVIDTLLAGYGPFLPCLTSPQDQAWLAAAFEAMAGLADSLQSVHWRDQLKDTQGGRTQIGLAAGLRALANAVEKELPLEVAAKITNKEPFELPPTAGWREFEPRPGFESADIKIRWHS